jgi:hypothetical protein
MGNVISYLAHLGIVRVLSVPTTMVVALYLIYRAAKPPPLDDDEDAAAHRG